MSNPHRKHIINKFLNTTSTGAIKASSFNEEDIKHLLLMISNFNDDHEERSEDIKLPIHYEDGEFVLQITPCWNGCARVAVFATHPTYCEVCESECEKASQMHNMEVNR